jgi:hypothetical protein
MTRMISIIAALLACAACQSEPGPQVARLPEATQPVCHDFTVPIKAGGRPEQASGQACEQPDGSWQITQNTPGLLAQLYTLPPLGQQPPAAASIRPPPTSNLSPSNQASCTSYTGSVTVGGQPRRAIMEACPRPDGSWKITQNTPGLPAQVYEIPPPASSPYPYANPYPVDYAYPGFFPYWLGEPWFFGLGPMIVVVQRFHSFDDGFGTDFGHGFYPGFGPGFSHGFAAGHAGGGGYR